MLNVKALQGRHLIAMWRSPSKYGVHRLVYYELCGDMLSAIAREKQLKKWNRAWKLELIEEKNPEWTDLSDEII